MIIMTVKILVIGKYSKYSNYTNLLKKEATVKSKSIQEFIADQQESRAIQRAKLLAYSDYDICTLSDNEDNFIETLAFVS